MCPATITAPPGSSPRADKAAEILASLPGVVCILIGPATTEYGSNPVTCIAEVLDARSHKKGIQKVSFKLPIDGGFRGLILVLHSGSGKNIAAEAVRRIQAARLPNETYVPEVPVRMQLPTEFRPQPKIAPATQPSSVHQAMNGHGSSHRPKSRISSLSQRHITRAVALRLKDMPNVDPAMRSMYECAWALALRFGRDGIISGLPGRLARSLGLPLVQIKSTLQRLLACRLIQPYAVSLSVSERDHLYKVIDPNAPSA